MDSIFSSANYESKVLDFWKENNIYAKIMENNKGGPEFNFVDGPPFVSSKTLHYGHVLIGYIKSTILNYKQMKGFNVKNKLGFDCHGLPIEMLVNKIFKEQGINLDTKSEIYNFGIDKFNSVCKDIVAEYSSAWTISGKDYSLFDRMGRFFDSNNNYKTCDFDYMKCIIRIFKELYDKNLVYIGYKIMPYSYKCATTLSNFEADNFKKVNTNSIFVKFNLVNNNKKLLVWTTTPWTLPCNVVLAVNPEFIYCDIEYEGDILIVAKSRIEYFTSDKKYNILAEYRGADIIGFSYEPLFDHYQDSGKKFFQIIGANWVGDDKGTGIVHISPGFGQDDFDACITNNIIESDDIDRLELCPINELGEFTDKISEYKGILVFDASKMVIKKLSNNIAKVLQINHDYPHCPRTDTMLIYRATKSIFLSVTKLTDKMLANVENINWPYGKNKFIAWLKGAQDWCLSRNRYFGTPIMMYQSDRGDTKVVGSVEELQKYTGTDKPIDDLHIDTVDNLKFIDNGIEYKRVPFVFDCWFESGSVLEYMGIESADFICEGQDQCRGWFYTMMVIHTALNMDKVIQPYSNVVCAGLLLDQTGKKFCKRLNNYIDPIVVMDRYNSDSMRLYLINSPASRTVEFRFKETEITTINKRLHRYCDVYNLIMMFYQKLVKDGIPIDFDFYSDGKYLEPIDKWIIGRTQEFRSKISECLDKYSTQVYDHFEKYQEDFTNNYINMVKKRAKSGNNNQKLAIFTLLFNVYLESIRILAPIVPFMAEYLYQYLSKIDNRNKLESIHMDNYNNKLPIFENINDIGQTLSVVDYIIKLRDTNVINMKYYLEKIIVYGSVSLDIDIIKECANVFEVEFKPISDVCDYIVVPNNKSLGQKYGKLAGKVKSLLLSTPIDELHNLHYGEDIIGSDFYDIKCVVKKPSKLLYCTNNIAVEIDPIKTARCYVEYVKLSFRKEVQKLRKNNGLVEENVIDIYFTSDQYITDIINNSLNELNKKLSYPVINLKPSEFNYSTKFVIESCDVSNTIHPVDIYIKLK